MARYGSVWLEIARAQYESLHAAARAQVDARIEELVEDPDRLPGAAYDRRTDQWTTNYGGGTGLVVFALVRERQLLIVLRLV